MCDSIIEMARVQLLEEIVLHLRKGFWIELVIRDRSQIPAWRTAIIETLNYREKNVLMFNPIGNPKHGGIGLLLADSKQNSYMGHLVYLIDLTSEQTQYYKDTIKWPKKVVLAAKMEP